MSNGIYIVGDLHCDWGSLNTFINKKNPAMILQVGDFGFWPNETYTKRELYTGYTDIPKKKYKYWDEGLIKNKGTKIHWCDGNHENHTELEKLEDNEIFPGIIYQPRGSVLTLPDGRNVLFIGGALSIDKQYRTIGKDWFPQELITQRQIYDLPDIHIDIVISHTCPIEFLYGLDLGIKLQDPCNRALSMVLEKYKPKEWFFGHFHQTKSGYKNECKWTCLDMPRNSGKWWTKLGERL